jgi:hypothetical protein
MKPARKAGYNDQRELATKMVIDDQSAMPEGDDPGYKMKAVIINLLETPIEHMRHQKLIDDAEYLAADRFRRLVEAARIGSSGATDPQKIRVDGNSAAEMQGRAIDAVRELVRLQGKLGLIDFDFLVQACTVGEKLVNIARQSYPLEPDSNAERKHVFHVGKRIREALKIVADHFGIADPRRDPRRSRLYRPLSERTLRT